MPRVHAPAGYGNGEVLSITALVSEAVSKADAQARRHENRSVCRSFMTAPNEAKQDLRARVFSFGFCLLAFLPAAAFARRAR